MDKIKIFLNPIESRKEYLDRIASERYRFVEGGSFLHKFEKASTDYRYAIGYIGYVNGIGRKKYTKFLNDMSLKIFIAPLNIGKISFGNIKLRPYNPPGSILAAFPGVINKEILIVENDGNKEAPVFSDEESRGLDLKRGRAPYYCLLVASVLSIVLGLFKLTDHNSIILGIIFSVFASFGLYKLHSIREE